MPPPHHACLLVRRCRTYGVTCGRRGVTMKGIERAPPSHAAMQAIAAWSRDTRP